MVITDHDGQGIFLRPWIGRSDQDPADHPKAAGHIARYPQMGAGEAFMAGWLVVEEPHDIRDMVLFVTEKSKAHGRQALQPQGR